MAEFSNKKYKDMTRDERLDFYDFLTHEMWRKGKTSIKCPICGGTITTKDIGIYGTSSLTECSTPGCVHIESRGI